VPVRFLSDAQREELSGFPAELDAETLDRFFTLSDADLAEVRRRHGDSNRLGWALQLCGLRMLGFCPDDMTTVPAVAVRCLARQLDVDPGGLGGYEVRAQRRRQGPLFGAYDLVGLVFSPRIRNLAVEPLVANRINAERVVAPWDDLLRVGASIHEEAVLPSLLLTKLQAFPRQNALARALQDYGRLVKTLFILRYPAAARAAQAGRAPAQQGRVPPRPR
jgi:TnpA family transposase